MIVRQDTEVAEEVIKTCCEECPEHCGLLVHVKDGRVVRIRGDTEHPLSKGYACIKGVNAHTRLYHPDRIKYPIKRIGKRGEGRWQRISWDEALDAIADKIQVVREKHGPLSICGGVNHCNWDERGMSTLLLTRSLGSPNVIDDNDICYGFNVLGDTLTTGELTTMSWCCDVRNTKCMLFIGYNPIISNPPHWYMHMRKAINRGAKLIVVDPRHSETAKKASLWLQIRPGTDDALALGMLNIVIDEKLYDEEFVDEWCLGFEKLKERVKEYSPEKVEKITWIPSKEIKKAARIFATTKPACLAQRTGVGQTSNAIQTVRAFACLVAITGNIDIQGGNIFYKMLPGYIGYADFLGLKEYRLPREIEEKRLGANHFPLWAGPDLNIGIAHAPTAVKAMRYGDPYPVKALIVFGFNPHLTITNGKELWEACKKLDLLVVVEQFMTPIAELADFVLPTTTFLERDDIWYDVFSHSVNVMQKTVEPPAECWDDMKIAIELLKTMKRKGYIIRTYIPWKSKKEFLDYRLKNVGMEFEDMIKKRHIMIPVKYKEYEDRDFRTPSSKVELYSSILMNYGYDPLPFYEDPPESEVSSPKLAKEYPLILITGVRPLPYTHSMGRQFSYARRIMPYPLLEISPKAAMEREIKDGDWVWIKTPIGRIRQKAKVTENIHPKVVCAQFGWWFPEKPGPEHGCWDSNINAIISNNPPYDPIIGNTTLRGLLCEVSKC